MGELVAPAQASFIPRGQMIDNVIITQEIIHSLKRKQGKMGGMILKLDLAKAYNRLEWSFIEKTLVDTSMPSSLITVITNCIRSGYCRSFGMAKQRIPSIRHMD